MYLRWRGICTHVRMYIYVHTYMCTYVHMYVRTYVYTYTQAARGMRRWVALPDPGYYPQNPPGFSPRDLVLCFGALVGDPAPVTIAPGVCGRAHPEHEGICGGDRGGRGNRRAGNRQWNCDTPACFLLVFTPFPPRAPVGMCI